MGQLETLSTKELIDLVNKNEPVYKPPSMVSGLAQDAKDYYQSLHEPTEPAISMQDFATRVLPESLGKTIVGMVEYPYHLAKSFTDPLLTQNPLSGMEDALLSNAEGVSKSIGEPIGVYGLKALKERWLSDPVGSILGIAPLLSGLKFKHIKPILDEHVRTGKPLSGIVDIPQEIIDKSIRGKSTEELIRIVEQTKPKSVEDIIPVNNEFERPEEPLRDVIPDIRPKEYPAKTTPVNSEWQELKPDDSGRLIAPYGAEIKMDFASGKTFIKTKSVEPEQGIGGYSPVLSNIQKDFKATEGISEGVKPFKDVMSKQGIGEYSPVLGNVRKEFIPQNKQPVSEGVKPFKGIPLTIEQPKGVMQVEGQGQTETRQVAPIETRVSPEAQSEITALQPGASPAIAATPPVTKSEGMASAMQLVGAIQGAHLTKNPAGTYDFVGRPNAKLRLMMTDGTDVPDNLLIKRQNSATPGRFDKAYGIKQRMFSTPEEAISYAKSRGLDNTVANIDKFELPKSPVTTPTKLSNTEYSSIEKQLKDVMDLKNNTTGWKQLDMPNGSAIINPQTKEVVTFEVKDITSGNELYRKKAEAQGYAIDHPIIKEAIPKGEIVTQSLIPPTIKESLKVEPKTVGGLKEPSSKPAKWLETTGEIPAITHNNDPVTKQETKQILSTSGSDYSAKALKEQKTYLIDEIDKAIELAPEEGINRERYKKDLDVLEKHRESMDWTDSKQERKILDSKIRTIEIKLKSDIPETGFITIDVPGDGKFRIINSKSTLKEFKEMAQKNFPKRIDTKFKPPVKAIATGSASKAYGLNNVTIFTYKGKPAHTDRSLLLFTEPKIKPKNTVDRALTDKDVDSIMPKDAVYNVNNITFESKDSQSEGVSDKPLPEPENDFVVIVSLKAGDKEALISQKNYNYIKTHFPEATFKISGVSGDAIKIYNGKQLVGIVMPIKAEQIQRVQKP